MHARVDCGMAARGRLTLPSRRPPSLLAQAVILLIAGLGTDVAGARAAIALAERIGAAIDHMHSGALLRDLDVMRASGVMLTTPGETRVRADVAAARRLPGLAGTWPELPQSGCCGGKIRERRIFWLCPGRDAATLGFLGRDLIGVDRETIRRRDLPALLASLRARVAGRPTRQAADFQ